MSHYPLVTYPTPTADVREKSDIPSFRHALDTIGDLPLDYRLIETRAREHGPVTLDKFYQTNVALEARWKSDKTPEHVTSRMTYNVEDRALIVDNISVPETVRGRGIGTAVLGGIEVVANNLRANAIIAYEDSHIDTYKRWFQKRGYIVADQRSFWTARKNLAFARMQASTGRDLTMPSRAPRQGTVYRPFVTLGLNL